MITIKRIFCFTISILLVVIQFSLLILSRLPLIGRCFMWLYIKYNFLGWDIYDMISVRRQIKNV